MKKSLILCILLAALLTACASGNEQSDPAASSGTAGVQNTQAETDAVQEDDPETTDAEAADPDNADAAPADPENADAAPDDPENTHAAPADPETTDAAPAPDAETDAASGDTDEQEGTAATEPAPGETSVQPETQAPTQPPLPKAPEVEEAMAELKGTPPAQSELIGVWGYDGMEGTQLEFFEDGGMTLIMDFSKRYAFRDGSFVRFGIEGLEPDETIPLTVEGDRVYAPEEVEMTALEGADPASLTGTFRLGDCALRSELTDDPSMDLRLLLGEDVLQVRARTGYLLGGETITLTSGSDSVTEFILLSGNTLYMIDGEGNTDTLHRLR
ncbi:MAG: hypothetical protein IJ055_01595 [Oscillospiraceae bacterium]|nr:hypothetical protein [Oscillospiraceae bacterium]